jgi:uncharacterized membrane protein YdbT with pleckstrin-like domain
MPPNTPPPASPPPLNSNPAPLPTSLDPEVRQSLDADEYVVAIIYRHIVGILFIYLEAFAAVAAILALVFLAFSDFFSNLSRDSNMLLAAGVIFALALLFFILFIATYIYRQSKIIVTNKNLFQVLQRGLFMRRISRLDISNVEDVTADQSGLLANMFNYGTLTVETAGAQKNFVFPYCPEPNKYANLILDARQTYGQGPD